MNLPARARKVLGDLRGSKSRTALVALSIAVGVAAVGTVAGARAMMLRSLDASREAGASPSATLVSDPFGEALLRRVRAVPGVRRAEGRRVVSARIAVGAGEWRQLTLTAVPDYARMRLARITPEQGAWPPPDGALLVERDSLGPLRAKVGALVRLELPDGTRRRLRIAGTVHDLNSPSATTSGTLYGYVTLPTLRRLGDRAGLNRLLVSASEGLDRRDVQRLAGRVRATVERTGRTVFATTVPEPGEFWAHDAVQSMVLLLTVLAVVCLLMSGFLVVNIVSALLAQQRRQIGVMKAVGATPRETALMYLAAALVFGVLALAVAVPVGAVAALVLVDYSTGLLNLDAPGLALPPEVLALELGAGLVVPVAAALAPVAAAGRTTVQAAIAAHGLDGGGAGEGVLDRLAERLSRVPAAVRLSFRNTFRRKRRLLLTLSTLVLGGAIFVAVLSVRASLARTLDDAARYRGYDVEVVLDRPYPAAALEREAAPVPGVARAEAWATGAAYRLRTDGSESDTMTMIGVPAGSGLIRPIVLRGRWLRAGDGRAAVVNSDVLDDEQDVEVGDRLRLRVNGRESAWRVVGVVRGIMSGPLVYADGQALGGTTGEPGLARRLEVVAKRHDPESQKRLAQALAERLKRAGFLVGPTQTTADRRGVDESNFRVLVSFLLSMAALIAVVVGLGLTGTLSINVLERGREIGVLRAIGAGDGSIVQLVVVEGLVTGALGWLVAVPLAVPIGRVLSDAVGRLFIGAPLTYVFSAAGAFVWLGIVVLVSVLASLLPAWRAARLTVREALVYE